jgi:RimJ/RimL family protein N-acetyltransferase
MPRIRLLERNEVALLRDLRLAALADAPRSFGETWEEVAARPPEQWQRWAADLAAAETTAGFVAEDEGHPCGLVFGMIDPARDDGARVGGMWVRPEARGRGVGTLLLEAVLRWAESRDRPRIGLWAPAHEPAALALYRRAGFRETGTVRTHRPGMVIVEMVAGSS